ncbi:MAG: alpha/beta fold hydrolase [Janthinobacterium lividum]
MSNEASYVSTLSAASRPTAGFIELPARIDSSVDATVGADDSVLRIEYCFVGVGNHDGPLLLFLHEGLGSVAMWKDWPDALCRRLGVRGLLYSRPGYGRSTPRPAAQKWGVDFMHVQATSVLPAFLDAIGLSGTARQRLWLVGHSDGGSIALLYAATFPDALAGAIVLAPHVFVEDISVESIAQARIAYETTSLRDKLARYHDDVDSAFRGWNDIWLDPAFRSWNIEQSLASISCPLLALQGFQDEYGTMAQMDSIAAHVPQAVVVKLQACGHSPHRDAPAALNDAIAAFLAPLLSQR